MITDLLQSLLGRLGYAVYRIPPPRKPRKPPPGGFPPPVHPVWPLPRRPNGFSDEEIKSKFAKYPLWYYGFEFEGGLSFPSRHNLKFNSESPQRDLQRFRHFMPYLLQRQGGSLRGKRVLDIACNAGFWSVQCALLGAEVVGFDARPEVIEQANLIKSIVGVSNVEFRTHNFWQMSPRSLEGQFDVVLFIGSLHVLPDPLRALELARAMARRMILLDTLLHPVNHNVIALGWTEAGMDVRESICPGIVARPSKSSVELMLKHIGASGWVEIPARTSELPYGYRTNKRATWLIEVPQPSDGDNAQSVASSNTQTARI